MMFIRNFTAGLVLGAAALAPPAQAQSYCAERETVIDRLEDTYGEALAAGGLQSSTRVVEVWVAASTGTWTLLTTTAEGLTCVMASGTNWHQNKVQSAAAGIPS